jgi:Ser/Thr protein kinase RdoA (MazF antagonist)
MEKWIREIFSENILNQVLESYEIAPKDCKCLDGFESFVYEVKKADKRYILKISHEHRKSYNEIFGEADYLNFLKSHGLTVSGVIPVNDENLIGRFPVMLDEKIDKRGFFTSVLYEFAPGTHVKPEQHNDELFFKMGKYLGKMHAITKQYKPEKQYRKSVLDAEGHEFHFIPENETKVRKIADDTMKIMRSYAKDSENFGLCHLDFHFGNFFSDNGNLWLFDFDDSVYSWFVNDIAIMLFYILPHHCESEEQIERGRNALKSILAGYKTENELSESELEKIPVFLKIRELELYAVIHRSCDLNNLDPWCASFMKNRTEKLVNNISFFPVDPTKV